MATPTYPLAWLLTPGGQPIVTAGGDRIRVVTDPAQAHDRVRAVLVEVETDRCTLTFGVAPCPATGTPCYNTLATCKARSAYNRGTKTWQFVLRGQAAPPGEAWRPYIEQVQIAPTEIKPANGLAVRSQTTVTLLDETDSDTEGDPYHATRTPAGTFWGRWVARNPNAINRTVRIRRGWWGQPFSYTWFAAETYIVDRVIGPDREGRVQLVLSDPIKLLDRAQLPAPTSGKLAAELKTVTLAGTLQTATATTAVLPAGALPDPAAYLDHELVITGNVGTGQRRAVIAYDPATLTLTVAAWDVVPNSTSAFELRPLTARLEAGQGAQYAGVTHVRIGREVIALSSVSGDVLRWSSATSRAAFGSIEAEHNAQAQVQACRVYVNTPPATVITDLLTASGLSLSQIDSAALAEIESTWFRGGANITACLTQPTKASDLLRDLLTDLALMQWWDPAGNVVRTRINLPTAPGTPAAVTDSDIVVGTVSAERLDAERVTAVAQFYALADATESNTEARSYQRGEVRVDVDAQSVNEYRDSRPDVRYSRWLSEANLLHVQSLVARRLNALRDAPKRITLRVDPRTALPIGDLRELTTRAVQGADGAPEAIRARVVKVAERDGQVEAVLQSTPFGGRRFGWIAPNGQPNYGSASAAQKQYAYISATGGSDFADGGGAYRII